MTKENMVLAATKMGPKLTQEMADDFGNEMCSFKSINENRKSDNSQLDIEAGKLTVMKIIEKNNMKKSKVYKMNEVHEEKKKKGRK